MKLNLLVEFEFSVIYIYYISAHIEKIKSFLFREFKCYLKKIYFYNLEILTSKQKLESDKKYILYIYI